MTRTRKALRRDADGVSRPSGGADRAGPARNLRDHDGNAEPTGPASTGDLVLDEVLRGLGEHERSWKSAVRHQYKQTPDVVERKLQSQSVLKIVDNKIAGLVP